MNCSVIIPAGGVGKRFGSTMPKQFIEMNGIPILIHTIRIFDKIDDVESIVIPVHNEWFTFTKEIIAKYECHKVKEVVIGGLERQDSVFNGIHTKSVQESEIVLVHDAVRPFASPLLVQNLINAAEDYGAAIPIIIPKDTIKEKNNKGIVVRTLDKNKHCLVQTPQAYWYDIISKAYTEATKASFQGTDEASLVEFIGYKVSVVEGEETNIKITSPFDLKISEVIFKEKNK